MATAVVMPKLGNSVESSIIVNWKRKKGDHVTEHEALCEIETDKATIEIESPASGTLLELFFKEGDDVPVMTHIAVIGAPGEAIESLRPAGSSTQAAAPAPAATPAANVPAAVSAVAVFGNGDGDHSAQPISVEAGISPRAKNLAISKGLDVTAYAIQGTGPAGRIIERDIQAALASRQKLTPLAKSMLEKGNFVAPDKGSGAGGRITSKDLVPPAAESKQAPSTPTPTPAADDVNVIQVKGTRRVIATRMLASLQTTAQLTLNASADARSILAYRKRLKASPATLELQHITINDVVLFAVSRTLLRYPDLNALYENDTISQYKHVNLGFAVDTPRGLIVPVIQRADTLSLKQMAQQTTRLAGAAGDSTITLDDMSGGTFTVTNLGSLGIESFTPILNPPQVGILGVGNVNLKPIEVDGDVQFIPHLSLSLTINHQVVDGAPGARFLQSLSRNLAELDLLLAL